MNKNEIASAYAAAYRRANRSMADIAVTEHEGWFRLDGQRVSRKDLLAMTERLNNRADGFGQVTDAELSELNQTA